MKLGEKVSAKIMGINYYGELVAVCNWKYLVYKNIPCNPDWIGKDIAIIQLDKAYPKIEYVDFKRIHMAYQNEELIKAMWEKSFINIIQWPLLEIKSCQ